MKRTPDGWDWTGGVATSSIGSQTVNFGTLEMMVSPDPEYLDMNANSGQITFSSDCSEINDAGLWIHDLEIGSFSGGICEVEVDVLQNIAKSEKLAEQIDFSVKHLGLEWPMSKFSIDVDWGSDPIRANAKLTSRRGREIVELKIRTVVPGIFKHQDHLRLRVTLIDSDRKQIGEEYEDGRFWLTITRREFLEIEDDFNCDSLQRVCGVIINISERDSGKVLFDKSKLVKMEKRRDSTGPIHSNIWAGEEEVDFPHWELQETRDDGYEWSDRPKIMSHDIRSRWGNELQPLKLDYDPSRISIGCFGYCYEVKVPLITDVDYRVLEQSEKSCELEFDIRHGDCKVRDEELIFDSVNNEIVARFLLQSKPIESGKISLIMRTHSIESNTVLLDLNLESLIEKMEKPYVDSNVLYFAKGKISDEDLVKTYRGFSHETPLLDGLNWCPTCDSVLWRHGGILRCTDAKCSENPRSSNYRQGPSGLFEYIRPVEISFKPTSDGFHYGFSTNKLDCSNKGDRISLKSLDGLHSISEKVSVLRRNCNGF